MKTLQASQKNAIHQNHFFKPLLVTCLAVAVVGVITGCRSVYRVDPVMDVGVNRPDIFTHRHWYNLSVEKDIFLDKTPYHMNPMTYTDGTFHSIPLYQVASSADLKIQFKTKAGKFEDMAVSTNDAMQARNRLQNTMIALAYENSSQHAAGIKSTENIANLALGGAVIGLSGGASVAAATTAKALAAAAAGTAGARALFNEETFRNNLAETMFQAMDSERELYRTTNILVNQTFSTAKYDVAMAIHDAEVYNEMASFYYQLSIVLKDVQKATDARTKSVNEAVAQYKKAN